MTMIERVARALAAMEYGEDVDDVWETHIPHARAAIAAMREPTGGMGEAAERWADKSSYYLEMDPADVWRAMIDVALEEKP
ncbi:hypothetical protein [Bosea minatitlanensis]|uniref:Uncharacterized protein n=1 Tax=Bosea minatitlanensis TaxID=128782 RepID=A0ABW0F0I6_9HYPH|nr:hypothetical protein [Bosea minatitlanensis]MCT4492725.1 hypothetical protein [Bosea minatitlanensis]